MQLREASEENITYIVNGNAHVCNQISQLIHATNYPHQHDKVKILKSCVTNVLQLLSVWQFADRSKKKRQNTAIMLHNLLAQLDTIKKKIDMGNPSDIEPVKNALLQIEESLPRAPFEEQWKNNISQLIVRYRENIERMQS